jgi:flagellar hook-associated protein 3 FlgL
MRISNQFLLQEAIRHLRGNLDALHRAQQEIADGRRIRKVSDDPIDASQIIRWEARLRDIDQYRRNAGSAEIRLSTEDAVLTSIRDLISRAKELAIRVSDHELDDPERQAAMAEMEELQEQILSLANSRVGDEYIFGGSRTEDPPFQSDGTYTGDSNPRYAEIDEGLLIETNHSGDHLFSDAFKAMEDLSRQLSGGNREELETIIADLDRAEDRILEAQTETGVWLRQIEDTMERLTLRSTSLANRRDAIRDADPAESVVRLLTAQTALEKSYEALGRVLSLSITNYLR